MKAAIFILLLGAQVGTTPTRDITIRWSVMGTPEYCLGSSVLSGPSRLAVGPNDIRLRLRLKLWYVNNRTEPSILPPQKRLFTRMMVPGQDLPITLRDAGTGGFASTESVLKFSPARPAEPFTIYDFSILAGKKSVTAPELIQCLSEKDPGCFSDVVFVPILDRASGLDLRGKTIQIVTTREHSLPTDPDLIQKLNAKWNQFGTVWTGSVDSEPLPLGILSEPSPQNCKP